MSPPTDACPICGKPPLAGLAPFCSKRCADIDLGRWLKGGYAIPGAPAAPESREKGVGDIPGDDPAED
jgi:endogenous inhibitor of DNA gyrase (YacG/DUF329 family)